jgi:hypothetical protein
MAMPAHDTPAVNPTPHTRTVSTMHLLNQVQRLIRLKYRLCSMAERGGAAGVCSKSEYDRNAKGCQ